MSFQAQGLPSVHEVWGWHEELAAMGSRFTGSKEHVKFIKWLEAKFAAVPGFRLHRDTIIFQRWLAQQWSLSITQDAAAGASGPVPVSYYYPYSGATGPEGVTGKLVDLGGYTPGWYTPAFWEAARGGIALVRVPPSVFSLDLGQIPTGGFAPNQPSAETVLDYEADAAWVTNPVFQGMVAPVPLRDARLAGVRGVICVWTGMSDDMAANQYNPITTLYPSASGFPEPNDPGCPALWVGDSTGQALAKSAAGGTATVTLTLTAEITKDAKTDTLWGVLQGSGSDHDRGLIVTTHTDGPSVPEENGALGLLALAQYFAGRPRRRDLTFVMATGHFQIRQFMQEIPNRFVAGNDATSLWMTLHPEIYQNALAGLSMEHLGCRMWADDAAGQYKSTGAYQWAPTYTAQRQGAFNLNNLEQAAWLTAVGETSASGAPVAPVVTMLPLPVFFGEGAPLYAGGLGTVALCPIPSYILQAGSRERPDLLNLDKLDPRLVHSQIESFARTISALDLEPAEAF